MIKRSWRLLILLAAIVIIAIMVMRMSSPSIGVPDDGSVAFEGGPIVPVEISDSQDEQVRGLSGRDGLAPGSGMLFVYDDQKVRTYWMKEMRFSIDIIWIADGQVIGFVERAVPPIGPGDPLDLYRSPEPADRVLEVEAGFIEEHGVFIGQTVVTN